MDETVTDPADPIATVVEAVAALETSIRPDLPANLLTPRTLARSGAAFGKLHEALTAAGVPIAAYSERFRETWAWVDAHPEQVDTVRLMGGDENDLVSALMTQWLRDVSGTAERTQAVMANGGDAASGNILDLASHRASRQRQRQRHA